MDFKSIRDKAVEKVTELKDSKQLSDLRDKAVEKAAELRENEQLKGVWDKAVDHVTAPQSNKQLVIDGAVGVALVMVTGGAIIPAIALAAAEGFAVKKWTESETAKKTADTLKNKKPGAPKDGPKPQ